MHMRMHRLGELCYLIMLNSVHDKDGVVCTTHTHGRFNYRVDAAPDADPVRAQRKSLKRLGALFTAHSDAISDNGKGHEQSGSPSSPFSQDAKGTFDKAAIATVFAAILANEESRAELDRILKATGAAVETMLRSERQSILNARLAPTTGVFSTGFQLEKHDSAVDDWDQPDHVAGIYYREIERVAMAATGATRAFCNGHLIRKSGDSEGPMGKLFTAISGPIRLVHNDFCEDYSRAIEGAFACGDDETGAGDGVRGGTRCIEVRLD